MGHYDLFQRYALCYRLCRDSKLSQIMEASSVDSICLLLQPATKMEERLEKTFLDSTVEVAVGIVLVVSVEDRIVVVVVMAAVVAMVAAVVMVAVIVVVVVIVVTVVLVAVVVLGESEWWNVRYCVSTLYP